MTEPIPTDAERERLEKEAKEEQERKEREERQRKAMIACGRYMEHGTSVAYGYIPIEEMQELATATQGVELPHAYGELQAAQLEMEAAISLAREYPEGGWESDLDPYALFQAGLGRLQAVRKNPRNDPKVRNRAQLAEASANLYKFLILEGEADVPQYRKQVVSV